MFQIGPKKFKNTVQWTYIISDSNEQEIVKKNCKKPRVFSKQLSIFQNKNLLGKMKKLNQVCLIMQQKQN